jgi:hypothetical protein
MPAPAASNIAKATTANNIHPAIGSLSPNHIDASSALLITRATLLDDLKRSGHGRGNGLVQLVCGQACNGKGAVQALTEIGELVLVNVMQDDSHREDSLLRLRLAVRRFQRGSRI